MLQITNAMDVLCDSHFKATDALMGFVTVATLRTIPIRITLITVGAPVALSTETGVWLKTGKHARKRP